MRIRALLQRSSNVCFQSALPQGVFIVNISYYYIGKRYINIIVWQGLELDTNNTQSISQKLLCILWCRFHNCCKTLNLYFTIPYELLLPWQYVLYIVDITDVKDYKAYYEGPKKGFHQCIHILDLYEIEAILPIATQSFIT